MMLREQTDEQLVDLYRAWDALEKQEHHGSIIDFDLAPARSFAPLESRREVLEKLQQMILALAPEKTSLATLARARLQASVTYLRCLLGESIRFEDYIEQTLCVRSRSFSEDFILAQKETVEWELRKLSRELKLKKELQFTADDAYRFDTELFISDSNTLPGLFAYFRSRWEPGLLEHVLVPINEYDIRVEFAREDAYWKIWISGDLSEHKILLRMNIHPRQIWYKGFSEILVIHEYCGHAVQMINWHRQIETGQLPQFMGILTVHFPDQFLLEGLAEFLSYFLPDDSLRLDPRSIVAREVQRYNLLVLNNVHVIANTEGPDAALDYAITRLPFTREETIYKEIQDRTQNPLFRGYQYVYGIAKETFLRTFSRLERTEAWNLLRLVYDTPMTADQFHASLDQFRPGRRARQTSYRRSGHS